MTPMMQTDAMAQAFNACTERENWKAVVGGTRTAPTVIFKSRTVMLELTYHATYNAFTVVFTKATCAFGDFMGAVHRSLLTVLTALKASGHDVAAPMELDDGVTRIQFDPKTKEAYVSLANMDDDWQQYRPAMTRSGFIDGRCEATGVTALLQDDIDAIAAQHDELDRNTEAMGTILARLEK